MPSTLPPGPFRFLNGVDGSKIPYYVIPFDKYGNCIGPQTKEDLLDKIESENYSDVFLFSHGWNNDFEYATGLYESFIDGFISMRKERNLPLAEGFKPLLIGVFWPSATFVMNSEQAPKFASADPRRRDPEVANEIGELASIAENVEEKRRERFYALAHSRSLNKADAIELAEIMLSSAITLESEVGGAPADAQELVRMWSLFAEKEVPITSDLSDFGTATPVESSEPMTAGAVGDFFSNLDPRRILRLPSVWKMKDRAGVIGSKGVNPLLRAILEKSTSKVHMVGHSYGAKVVLSGTCFGGQLPRPVSSMLLLQGALSHLAFADSIPGSTKAGGYQQALNRVQSPILATFSSNDFPLTKAFHFAVRRKSDLGEAKIAASEPPSRFAALGGFGPRGANEKLISVQDVGKKYELDESVPIYGIEATRTVSGHGDVSNPSTWWMLYNLVSASMES